MFKIVCFFIVKYLFSLKHILIILIRIVINVEILILMNFYESLSLMLQPLLHL